MTSLLLRFAALAAAASTLAACASSAPAPAPRDGMAAPVQPRPSARIPERPRVEAQQAGVGVSQGVAQFVQASSIHRTLAAALVQAQLTDALSGAGPFTLLAPTDAAFNAVPISGRSGWWQEANRAQLQGLLRRHVVQGRLTAADLTARVQAGGGAAGLTTLSGEQLTVRQAGGRLTVTDASGAVAAVTSGDYTQPNGVVHVLDRVLTAH